MTTNKLKINEKTKTRNQATTRENWSNTNKQNEKTRKNTK